MTWTPATEPVDGRTFRESLTKLIVTARQNDIEVERAWDCRADADESWEVEIVRVAPEDSTPE